MAMFKKFEFQFEKLQSFVQKKILSPEPKLSYLAILGLNCKKLLSYFDVREKSQTWDQNCPIWGFFD